MLVNGVYYNDNNEAECFNSVSGRSDHVSADAQDVARRFTYSRAGAEMEQQKQYWKVRAQKKDEKKRYVVVKNTILACSCVSCVSGTLFHFDARIQIMLYIQMFAIISLCDPFGAVGRFVALPSRVLFSVSCGSLLLLGGRPSIDTFCLSCIVIGISAFLIKTMNESWLSADNWKDTDAVELALERDPNNLGGMCWQAQGKRETRTALRKLGMSTDDSALDYCHQAVFEVGYSHGLQKAKQVKAMENKLIESKNQLAFYKDRCKRLEEENTEALEDNERLQDIQAEKSAQDDYWKRLYMKEQERSKQLEQANNDLLQNLIEDEEQAKDNVVELKVVEPVKTPEQIVIEAREKGLSYQKAGDLIGVSRSTAYRMCQKAEQENIMQA